MTSRRVGRAALAGLQSGAPALAGPRLVYDTTLEVQRRLPVPGQVTVSAGDAVRPDSVLATAANAPTRLHIVDLTLEFERQLEPDDVRAALLVSAGELVAAGAPVARLSRRGWFDREELVAVSPADGVVEFVSVARGQVVIRSSSEVRDERISLAVASYLGIEPHLLPAHAACRPGQTVVPGDLLAHVTGFRPMGNEYRSPIGGVVETVSPLSGTIVIVRETESLTLYAYMSGRVAGIIPGYGARVAARGHRVLGVLGLGGKSWGPLHMLADAPSSPAGSSLDVSELLPDDVSEELAGRVLAVPGVVSARALEACREHRVRGVIAGSARAEELSRFIGRPLAAEIVTGPGTLSLDHYRDDDPRRQATDSALTVILTEGFGRLAMDSQTWALLSHYEGHLVSVDGLTQIRAGVVRPTLLIPTGDPDGGDSESSGGSRDLPSHALDLLGLAIGQRVRLVRQPHFGCWGTIVELPHGLTRLETEVEARVLLVRLDDGRLVQVAEANVEL